jgi:hypothetical protein
MRRLGASRVRRAAVAAVAAFCAVALAACGPVAASFGVHNGTPSQDQAFESWAGAKAAYAMDFSARGSWADIAGQPWQLDEWEYDPGHHRLVLSLGMTPDNQGDLLSGARGNYNWYFAALASKLVSHHLGNTIIRLGWEFNGSWFRWGINKGNPSADRTAASEYAQFFRQAVNAMRSVRGGHFAFDWCVNNGDNGVDPTTAYPGDAYVNYVGIDAYDMVWGPYNSNVTNPAARWNTIANGKYGLNFWALFAAVHHKPVSVPEWGLWAGDHGGGDDTTYIANMHTWFSQHNVAYEMYFNDSEAVITNGQFPASAALYRRLF